MCGRLEGRLSTLHPVPLPSAFFLNSLSLSPSLFVTLSHLTPSQSPPLSPNAAPHNTAHHSLTTIQHTARTNSESVSHTYCQSVPACPLNYLPVLLLSTAARTVRTEQLLHIIYTHNEYVKFLIPFYNNLDVLLEDRADTATEESQCSINNNLGRGTSTCVYLSYWLADCVSV